MRKFRVVSVTARNSLPPSVLHFGCALATSSGTSWNVRELLLPRTGSENGLLEELAGIVIRDRERERPRANAVVICLVWIGPCFEQNRNTFRFASITKYCPR